MGDLISRSALIEVGSARKIIEAVGNWNELPLNAKAACTRLGCAHKKLILEAPAVDAVEVVRCKDCKKFGDISPYTGTKFDFKFCNKFGNVTKETDFCSYGERRADDGRSKAD